MRIVTAAADLDPTVRTVATIGAFDGVHVGHRALIGRVVGAARDRACDSLVITLRPHPLHVLRPESAPALVTRYEDRADRIRGLGVDWLLEIPFDATFAALSARQFVEEVLVRAGVVHVVAGPDLRFGSDRSGDLALLTELGPSRGFTAEGASPVLVDGELASSTRVRRLIGAGDVAAAARVLGQAHRVVGDVIHGDARGRTIGFPTANLGVSAGPAAGASVILPPPGVYATWAFVAGVRLGSVTNIGWRPTVNGRDFRFETHLFDFAGDLYGRPLVVDFIDRLRDEQRFSSLDALVAQIRVDAAAARAMCETASHAA